MAQKPVDKFEDYPVGIALFEREGENGTWINADVSKTYKDGDEYKKSRNFSRVDLMKLNALVPHAIARMQELDQKPLQARTQANGQDMEAIKQESQNHLAQQSEGQEQTP